MKSIKLISFLVIFLSGTFFFYPAWSHDKPSRANLLPKMYPAPEFTGLENWINSSEIRSMRELRGKVVLIDFWTFEQISFFRPENSQIFSKYFQNILKFPKNSSKVSSSQIPIYISKIWILESKKKTLKTTP